MVVAVAHVQGQRDLGLAVPPGTMASRPFRGGIGGTLIDEKVLHPKDVLWRQAVLWGGAGRLLRIFAA